MLAQQRMKYLETSIQTASPQQLLIMLYDGAIRYCKLGMEGIRKGNLQEANTNLIRCQDIIRELMVTLNPNIPLSESLRQLYDYFIHLLITGNTKKELAPLEEVLNYLTELRETWAQAALNANAGKPEVSHG